MISAWLAQYLLPLLALAVGAIGLWFGGKSVGKSKAEKAHAEEKQIEIVAKAEKQVDVIKGATDVQNDVNKLDNGGALNKLRADWKRKDTN